MLIANKIGFLRVSSGFNAYGEPIFGARRAAPCAVVSLNMTTQKTSVRTDSSATRGNAEEVAENAKILFPVRVGIKKGMKFEIASFELRVIDVQPRYAVSGVHDHDECLLSVWRDETSRP